MHFWSEPKMSTTQDVKFDEGYNQQVIDLPVIFPLLHNHNSFHEARVTVNKLTELYAVMYSFIDGGNQDLVGTTVKMPVLHNFTSYNEDYVTVVTLQAMYRCLYKMDKDSTQRQIPSSKTASASALPPAPDVAVLAQGPSTSSPAAATGTAKPAGKPILGIGARPKVSSASG